MQSEHSQATVLPSQPVCILMSSVLFRSKKTPSNGKFLKTYTRFLIKYYSDNSINVLLDSLGAKGTWNKTFKALSKFRNLSVSPDSTELTQVYGQGSYINKGDCISKTFQCLKKS